MEALQSAVRDVPLHPHAVQFYEEESFLGEAVVPFLERGLRAGQPVLVIATAEHWRIFEEGLRRRGVDVDGERARGSLSVTDAEQALRSFTVDGQLDEARFFNTIGALVSDRAQAFGGAHVAAYGEMVDVLWQRGESNAAMRLEELWNELIATQPLSLLCAYTLSGFDAAAHGSSFEAVCRLHTHVLPADGYPRAATEADRQREVARLQQRACALEAELAHRRRLEGELQDAIQARDEFISIAAHELRNPLHAIHLQVFGALHAARAGVSGQLDVTERLSRAADQVARLSRLVDNLLDVSRITAGRIDLELEAVDCAEVVRSLIDRNAEEIPRGMITMTLSSVVGQWDRLRLEQIMTNLVSNAVKYGRGKPIEISLEGDTQHARLRVADAGVGIEPPDLARVFARFERAMSPSRVGGFGLGLWITRQLVEAMDGTIDVDSRPGVGSTFTVTLPLSNVSRSGGGC